MGAMNSPTWSHRSFTAPFTATGRAALVPPPPWHYAGWLLNVAFRFDASTAIPLVPPAAGRPVGAGCVHFADWQACTDGHEMLDPVLAQYRETIVVLEIERPDGSRCMYCPAIWVDQDIYFTRWFKRTFGYTPGTQVLHVAPLAKAVNYAPDGVPLR